MPRWMPGRPDFFATATSFRVGVEFMRELLACQRPSNHAGLPTATHRVSFGPCPTERLGRRLSVSDVRVW
jgi:hypothetical protein